MNGLRCSIPTDAFESHEDEHNETKKFKFRRASAMPVKAKDRKSMNRQGSRTAPVRSLMKRASAIVDDNSADENKDSPTSVDRFCCAALILVQGVVWILMMPFQLAVDACKGWPEVELQKMSIYARKLCVSRQAVTEADRLLLEALNNMLALISLRRVQFFESLSDAAEKSGGDKAVHFDEWWDAVLEIKGTSRFVTNIVKDIGKFQILNVNCRQRLIR